VPLVNIFCYTGTDMFLILLKSIYEFGSHFGCNFVSQMQKLADIRIIFVAGWVVTYGIDKIVTVPIADGRRRREFFFFDMYNSCIRCAKLVKTLVSIRIYSPGD